MDRTKFLTVIIIILLLLNMGTLGYLFISRNYTSGPRKRPEGPAKFIIESLKFDDAQVIAFNELKEFHHSNMVQKQDSLRLLRDEYFKGLKTDTPDTAKAEALIALIAQKQKEIERLTFDHFMRVRALCNEEQKKLFDSFINEILRAMAPPHHPKERRPPRH